MDDTQQEVVHDAIERVEETASPSQNNNNHGDDAAGNASQPTEPNNATEPAEKQTFMQAARSQRLRPFIIISISYLLFTITDGAIRMIVLLHAYNKSFSALQVAFMFTLYELAGVVTNLAAGLMGARWGIRFTLIFGLLLQILSYGLLFGWRDDWSQLLAIVYVTVAQMFAGIAKDLTKLGGKTVTKLVTPEEKETQLFKLVSLLTGWKNSLKGVGYFLGSALLQVSYELALCFMIGLIVIALPFAIFGLDKSLGTAKNSNARWQDVFYTKNANLNILSLARLFLFASRDFWFEVPLPFFLRSPSCDGLGVDNCSVDADCTTNAVCDAEGICQNLNAGGGCGGPGFPRAVAGAFLGGYIILYGQVQSWTPQLVTGPLKQVPPNKLTEVFWGLINCLPTLAAAIVLQWTDIMEDESAAVGFLLAVIISFAIIFAVNSSIHSFMVVNYASAEKLSVSVGFYYMSNAVGRLFGTLGSGFLYTYVGDSVNDVSGNDAVAGFAACFFAGTCSSLLAALITTRIDDHQTGLKCGSCLTLVAAQDVEEKELDDEKEVQADGTKDEKPTEKTAE